MQLNRLEKALATLLDVTTVKQVTGILARAAEIGRISYEEARKEISDDPDDALLTANSERLLIPVRSCRGTLEWDDAILLCIPGESYRMPNIIRHLVKEAEQTGQWNPKHAVGQLFREIGEQDWESMFELIQRLGERASYWVINAGQIVEICTDLGIRDKVDLIVAELKGSGVMSPKLGSMTEAMAAGSPLYKLNPSLFVGDPSNESFLHL